MNVNAAEIEGALSGILSGREERVKTRNTYLSEGVFACQIALNIPGYPKRIQNDRQAIEKFAALFCHEWGADPFLTENISNEAGLCWIGFFHGEPSDSQRAKKIAVGLEEGTPEGRIFDIDIIVKGISLSRSDMGLPSRSCILCGSPAKECARERNHPYTDLRDAVEKLIKNI